MSRSAASTAFVAAAGPLLARLHDTRPNHDPATFRIGAGVVAGQEARLRPLLRILVNMIARLLADRMSFEDACSKGNSLLKDFMLRQTRQKDLALFVELSGTAKPASPADVPTYVAVPAFAISEFRTSFEMGCLLFIPFLLIDLVVASILLSTGMMMLPPAMISMPFKILLFILVDGWHLVVSSLMTSYQ